jgi:hypothetical protein
MLAKAMLIEAPLALSPAQAGFVPAGVRYLSKFRRRRSPKSAARFDPLRPSVGQIFCVAETKRKVWHQANESHFGPTVLVTCERSM